jgi:hypothetical protein
VGEAAGEAAAIAPPIRGLTTIMYGRVVTKAVLALILVKVHRGEGTLSSINSASRELLGLPDIAEHSPKLSRLCRWAEVLVIRGPENNEVLSITLEGDELILHDPHV